MSVLPQQSAGWPGTPGLSGHRAGRTAAPAFTVRARSVENENRRLTVEAVDPDGGLALTLELGLTDAGLVRLRAAVTNTGDGPYHINGLTPALPVPAQATELLDLTGRHLRERAPQRHAFTLGTHLREGRRGRTGSDATLLLTAGEAGFGFRSGEVWGLHVAWSGNHRTLAERTPAGQAVLAGGELLLPGELRLAPGATYRSPGSTPPTDGTVWTSWPGASTASCGPATDTRPRPARSPSTPGRRSTSTRTWPRWSGWRGPRPRSARSGSCWMTAGSGGGGTIAPGSATGMWTPRSGRTGCGR